MKALAVGLMLVAVPLSAAAPPEISFEPDAVVARGITPKGQAVWFSVAREISRRSINVVPRLAVAADEDGEPDGTLRAALSSLTPVQEGGPPPPERFSPHDVLLIIDPERLEFAMVRIGQ